MNILLADVFDSAGQKSACTASGVKHAFAKSRVHDFRHDFGDGSRGVEFTVVARTLQVSQQSFVNVAEQVAVFGYVEVDFIEFIHHLTDDGAVFHVVVDAVEDVANKNSALVASRNVYLFQARNQLVVNEFLQGVARHAFAIGSPVAPLQFFGDYRLVVIIQEFHFGILVVDNLERNHPAQLFNALCIARNTLVFSHDVLQGLDNSTDVGH